MTQQEKKIILELLDREIEGIEEEIKHIEGIIIILKNGIGENDTTPKTHYEKVFDGNEKTQRKRLEKYSKKLKQLILIKAELQK